MKKRIIVGLIILVGLGGFFIFQNSDPDYQFTTVEERELVEEVFETGVVKSGDLLNLSLRSGGQLSSLSVSKGERVDRGQFLAGIDTTDMELQRAQAEARIESQTAELDMLKKGADDNRIKDLKNRLDDARRSVETAKRSLSQAEESRQTALENSYIPIPSLITKVELFSRNVKEEYKDLKERYFTGFYLQDTYVARRLIRDVENQYDELRVVSRSVDKNSNFKEMDEALSKAEEALDLIERHTETLIDISETDFYERRFSPASQSLLRETKNETSEILSSVSAKKGEIRSIKDETEAAIISAEANLNSAKAQKNELEDTLESAKRGGREEEIAALEANLRSAIYDLRLAEREIEKSRIYTPESGKITKLHFKENEQVSPGSPVVTLLTDKEFYIETDIYEGDIASVNIGDPVSIELVAYPGEVFTGQVRSIDQTGQLIDGVVYYQVDISFENPPEGAMNEMSADVTIETSKKRNISLPREVIGRDGGRRYVQVLDGDSRKEVDIEVGVTDAYGYVEILDGLSEGDQVLID